MLARGSVLCGRPVGLYLLCLVGTGMASPLTRQIVGNMLHAFGRLQSVHRCKIGQFVGLPQRQRGIDACILVAHLTGLNIKTLRSLVARFERNGGCDSGPWLVVGNDGMATTSVSDPLDAVADISDPSDRHGKALPAVHFPEVDTCNLCHANTDVDTDSDVDLQFGVLPSKTHPMRQLAAWQQHANYARGMRVAELAMQWITSGNSCRSSPFF